MPINILLVDDDQDFRSALLRLLKKEKDFSVVGDVGNGGEAVEVTRALQPDIILMDLVMPGVINGLEATRRIKAERPETRIIILTQHQDDAYRQEAARSGADAFLTKTTRLAYLLTTIRQLIEGVSKEPGPNPPLFGGPEVPEAPSSG